MAASVKERILNLRDTINLLKNVNKNHTNPLSTFYSADLGLGVDDSAGLLTEVSLLSFVSFYGDSLSASFLLPGFL